MLFVQIAVASYHPNLMRLRKKGRQVVGASNRTASLECRWKPIDRYQYALFHVRQFDFVSSNAQAQPTTTHAKTTSVGFLV